MERAATAETDGIASLVGGDEQDRGRIRKEAAPTKPTSIWNPAALLLTVQGTVVEKWIEEWWKNVLKKGYPGTRTRYEF